MNNPTNEQSQELKIKEFFERARKGVLKYVDQKGGALPMLELHEYSLKTYFIQHQRFSQLMESLVDENLLEFDSQTETAVLTEKGRGFIQ